MEKKNEEELCPVKACQIQLNAHLFLFIMQVAQAQTGFKEDTFKILGKMLQII